MRKGETALRILICLLLITLLAACGEKPQGKPPITGPPPEPGPPPIVSIKVTPGEASIAAGTTQDYIATGTRVNGTTVDMTPTVTWSSSNQDVATIDGGGRATGKGVGTTEIIATHTETGLASTLSGGDATLSVTPAVLVSIQVAPVVESMALAQQVMPAEASIPKGLTQQFKATGVFSDNTSQDITASVAWGSSDPYVATIDGEGLATGVGVGTTAISASDPSTGTNSTASGGDATLYVTPAELVAVQVAPAGASIALGLTWKFAATGTYTDLSSRPLVDAVWSSSDPYVASVDMTGLATGNGVGTTAISATDPATGISSTVSSGDAILTVTPAELIAIQVTPAEASIPKGLTQKFEAWGSYTDKSTRDLTLSAVWDSVNTGVATVDGTGLATGVGVGITAISATDPSTGTSSTVSGGDAGLSVTPAALISIAVEPAEATFQVTQTRLFTATGTYTDLSSRPLTDAVWSSSDAAVAVVSAGLATGTGAGFATISAADPATGISSADSASSASVTVMPLAPELTMTIDRVATNGLYSTVFYTVSNNGGLEAPAGFVVEIWADLGTPPAPGAAGDASKACPALNAGQEYSDSVTFMSRLDFGTAYGVVDSGGMVEEADESNNVSAGLAWDSAVSCNDVAETLGGVCTDTDRGFTLSGSGGASLVFGGYSFDDDPFDVGTMNICSLALFGDGGQVFRHAGAHSQENIGVFGLHWAGVASNCSRGYASDLIAVGTSINWTAYPTGETCGDKDTDAGLTALVCEYGTVYSSADVPKYVNYGTPSVVSTIEVSGASPIADIQVHVDITHTWDSDLDIFLESPAGTLIELSTGNGASKQNYTNTTFNDKSTVSIVNGKPPFTGTYRPEAPLSALVGQNPNGTWKLRVTDTFSYIDDGTLNAWSLEILGQ